MHRPPAGARPLTVLVLALMAVACSSTGTGGSPSPASAVPSAVPTTATAAPSMDAPASPATTAPSDAASPSAEGTQPPAASLSVEGGEPVAGQLGSYTWNGGGSDSPWLPGAPMTVGAGERLNAALDGGVGIATWSARRVAAGSSDGAGAVGLGDGSGPARFASPGTGRWSIQLMVRFADDLGSAAYYWDVTVR